MRTRNTRPRERRRRPRLGERGRDRFGASRRGSRVVREYVAERSGSAISDAFRRVSRRLDRGAVHTGQQPAGPRLADDAQTEGVPLKAARRSRFEHRQRTRLSLDFRVRIDADVRPANR